MLSVLVLAGGACDLGRDAHGDLDAPADMAPSHPRYDLAPIPCSDAQGCPMSLRCYLGFCIADNGACTADSQCQNDTYCACPNAAADGGDGGGDGGDDRSDGGDLPDGGAGGCLCVPWGRAPRGGWDLACRRPAYPISEVVPPVLLCQYSGDGVETTPLVADLDGDGAPEVVFTTTGDGHLHAMHGADCSPYFESPPFDLGEYNSSQLAVADLDGDGVPEIIGVDRSRRVAVFSNQGVLLASSPAVYSFKDGEDLGGPAIVDLDGKAPPEIVVAGQALRYESQPAPAHIVQLWADINSNLPLWGVLSVAADLDGDGLPEVVAGSQVYRGTSGADVTPPMLVGLNDPRGDFAGIADFNLDGRPDLALVIPIDEMRRKVAIYDWANARFLLEPTDASDGWGSAPTLADFDGDGLPEMAVAGIDRFILYSPECAVLGPMRPTKCAADGLAGEQWSRRISDQSSGSASAAAFDFNGDGVFEIIYRDECWLRALDGRTGKALFAVPVSSASGLEEPTLADLDGDGHAEIIVSSTAFPQCPAVDDAETGTRWTGLTNGVLVFSDPRHQWMPARPLWNQHSYHVTNVLDDLTVPNHESPGWQKWNGYRQNEQGLEGQPDGVGDFTSRVAQITDPGPMNCNPSWTLFADLCNRGAGTAPRGIPGAFYDVDPRGGSARALCVARTRGLLRPGGCETVSCDWVNPPRLTSDVWFRADDDGQSAPAREECRDGNDLMWIKQAHCDIPG